ncbi:MAG: hypothetical protein JW757_02820 [Anaerolineales bacterium]|nr:hypothetical protein [Anaerolineales bacterium]
MRRKNLIVLLPFVAIIIILLPGCGSEIARVSIQNIGHYEFEFIHTEKSIALWTDLDIEYIESTTIWYEIQFYKKGDFSQEVICNPFDHKFRLMSRETNVRGVTKVSYLAPMMCEVDLSPGEYWVEVDFYAEGGRVRIFRADLVIHEKD